jgi:hypothetical protein
VAGDAAARSPTSKIIDIVELIAMISEFGRQSFLLSSSTVFIFSIQMASTGPSRTHLKRMTSASSVSHRQLTSKSAEVAWLANCHAVGSNVATVHDLFWFSESIALYTDEHARI